MFEFQLEHLEKLPCGDFTGAWSLPDRGLHGLFGENGIGKSTLLRGIERHYFRGRPGAFCTQGEWSPLSGGAAERLLELCSRLSDWDQARQRVWLETFPRLQACLERPFDVLSGGQKQLIKLFFHACLLRDFYAFDEPLANLDPQVSELVVEKLRQLSQRSCVLFVVPGQRINVTSSWWELKREDDEKRLFLEEKGSRP